MQELQKFKTALAREIRGEASRPGDEGSQFTTTEGPESPNFPLELMEEVLRQSNLLLALKRVKSNKGAAGVDDLKVEELDAFLRKNWKGLREQLLSGDYEPRPVRRVEIPKPDCGTRLLGIPTVLDRFIQQALCQVLQREYDKTFSNFSFGFRPNRSAHQAVKLAQEYQRQGNRIVVDIDLEKFFDRVNHDKLMGKLREDIKDKRVLKLIRGYLRAGIMENGLVSTPDEGTPQGGPLSPLLSNIVLDELDKELERRGHKFVRYADDQNIYVKSLRAGERVMKSVKLFIEKKLKLKVNDEKSKVAPPYQRKFLGFSFHWDNLARIRIAHQSLKRFKDRIRQMTRPTRRISFLQLVGELKSYLQGWLNYFGIIETPSVFKALEEWLRHRLRNYIWQQWKKFDTRINKLMKFGIGDVLARKTASSGKGAWRISASNAMLIAFPSNYFEKAGIPRLVIKKI